MSVITISRGSYSHGKRVAEQVADKLGYECISREDILRASNHYDVSQIELFRAAHEGPVALRRIAYGKQRYVTHVRKAILDRLGKDNVVYHGFVGHLFVQGVSHVLKVRIVADLEQRVPAEMSRRGISATRARKSLEQDDAAHIHWSRYLSGADMADPKQYDMVLPMKNKSIDEAVEIITRAARGPSFQPTAQSRGAMELLLLAARVQESLMEETPFAKVGIEETDLVVTTRGLWAEGRKMMHIISEIIDYEKAPVGIRVRLVG
jgi:cytidylate kinase